MTIPKTLVLRVRHDSSLRSTDKEVKKPGRGKRALKTAVLLLLLGSWGILNLAIFRNERLIAHAKGTEDLQERISFLRTASTVFPIEPHALYELGKAHFDRALQHPGKGTPSEVDLRNSIAELRRSIRFNPFSALSHFQLGQSLIYLGPASINEGSGVLEEYRKAVALADRDSRILLEVGETCLKRWPELSEQDRDFALGIMQKVFNLGDLHQAQIIFETWETNSKDIEIMRRALPEKPGPQRAYADFLAANSLSVGERQNFLAKAERLEYEAASGNLRSAEYALSHSQIERASGLLQSCLYALKSIQFYQDLTGEMLIDPEEFRDTLKACLLNLVKCGIESGQSLEDLQDYLWASLDLEDLTSSLNKLEIYLIESGRIELRKGREPADPDQTAFKLAFLFKKARYMDIVGWGRSARPSLADVPSSKFKANIRIFQILGDACQKAGFPYDAREYYRRVLALDPLNIETLIRMKMGAERLNSEPEALAAEEAIRRSVSNPDIISGALSLQKGEISSWPLRLDGQSCSLGLQFAQVAPEPFPLLSVVFNGRVVWEGYVAQTSLTIPLKPRPGDNLLTLTCLNRTLVVDKIVYR